MGFVIYMAYMGLTVFTWTRVYKTLYRNHVKSFPRIEWSDSDRAFGVLWGGFVSLFWPVLWVGYGLVLLIKSCGPLLSRLEN